jgi:hypothetical protein
MGHPRQFGFFGWRKVERGGTLLKLFVQVMALVGNQLALGAQKGIGLLAAGAGKRHFTGGRIKPEPK